MRIVWICVFMILVLAGCATPPKSRQVSYDPLLGRQGGVLLLVDSTVQIDVLAGDDYFVVDEAKSGGQAAISLLRNYIEDRGIHVCGEAVTVGSARLNVDNSPIVVADNVGGPTRRVRQPLWFSESITNDPQFINALGVISTYAFERAAVTTDKAKAENNTSKSNIAQLSTINDFRNAAEVIKAKTHASSVLFVGILGKSRSQAKALVQSVGSFAVGMGTAFLTAGLGTGYYLMFMPGHELDGMVMEGALIDLESGQLSWSNTVKTSGDPIKSENMANPQNYYLLFHDLLFNTKFVQPTSSVN